MINKFTVLIGIYLNGVVWTLITSID